MNWFIALAASVTIASACLAAEIPKPLLDLSFDGTLDNKGGGGGQAAFVDYAPGEGALYDRGPFGECLDLTAAKRHGGTLADKTPTGGAVTCPGRNLPGLESFTLMLWARENPAYQGVSPRLAMTQNAWDWLPAPGGMSIGLGSGATKSANNLLVSSAERLLLPPPSAWRFYAVAVGPDTVKGYIGGLRSPLQPTAEVPRTGPHVEDWGDVVIGTWGGIRPFNGWLARFRIYPEPLPQDMIATIFNEDCAAAQAPKATIWDLARPPQPPRKFTLPRSAIPFSTRWQKPESLDIMASWHTTHCMWVYGTKPEFIRKAQGLGLLYQGTLNGLQGTGKAKPGKSNAGDTSGRHEDLDGNKNMPSWMVTFKPPHYTGCCNSPAFREIFFTDAKKLVDLGVDMIQVDDGAMNASWVRAVGVCFCETCRAGFRDWLRRRHTPEELKKLGIADIEKLDYREHLKAAGVPDVETYRKRFKDLPLTPDFIAFQVESARRFYQDFRAKLDEWSPKKYIPISLNEALEDPGCEGGLYHTDLVDFFLSEMYLRTLGGHLAAAKLGEALNLPQIASPIPRSVTDARRTTATMYALGQLQLVPWDIYMGSDATGIQPRYFGTREEYGDLYDFIHQHPQLFNDYESMAEVGLLYNADVERSTTIRSRIEALARMQIPFNLLPVATRDRRIALRETDLKPLRAVVLASPLESLCDEDRKTLDKALSSRRVRLIPADSLECLRAHETDVLEGVENIYAFPRVAKDKSSIAIHLVNWNELQGGKQADNFKYVTLTLRHPQRWGALGEVKYYEPGAEPVSIEPERHEDIIRLTVPKLGAWGLLVLRRK